MNISNDILTQAWLIIAFGMLGTFVPLLPGPSIVWMGAFYYAWQTNYAKVGIPMLIILALLAIIASTADLWASALGAKKSGASGWATVASIVGSVIGLLLFSLPGLFIGAIAGIALVEYSRHKNWNSVLKASGGYLLGYVISLVVQFAVCILMIAIFAFAVYR